MSDRFLQLYDALPPDAQQLLVRTHLAPLLDAAPRDRQKRVAAAASDMHARYARMPRLNLKAKKAEIAGLLCELNRDAKRSVIRERSRREQLLAEAIDTLARWLNDIWKVVFEFRTNFAVAHSCLLFACDALEQIGNGCGACRCAYVSMFVPVDITRSTGKLVKSFRLNGAHNLENVVLWIWRDLFITVLTTGTNHQRSIVPDMIDDIRLLLGWRALEHLLRGGTKSFCEQEDEDEDLDLLARDASSQDIVDDDGDQNYVSDDDEPTPCDEEVYPNTFCAAHWSWRITDQQSRLRDIVHTALLSIFKVAPSGPLYSCLISIAEDEDDLEEELHPLLMSVAGHSSENLSAALRIMSLNNRTESIDKLIKAHKHLLRPQDAASLQFASLIMSSNPFYRKHAISIVEEELVDVARVFHAAIRFSFCNITAEIHKTELTQILALRRDSLNRRNRVERWVKAVLTPQVDNTHPMALAALMIGFPIPPTVENPSDGDMLGYFAVEGDDPEVEDLREEFRPNIKTRLQGWIDTAVAIKGGPPLLARVYTRVAGDMPFLKAKDVVEEMSSRIADRPSKQHVADGLDAFRDFCEKQSQRLATAAAKARPRGPSTARASASRSQASNPIEDVE